MLDAALSAEEQGPKKEEGFGTSDRTELKLPLTASPCWCLSIFSLTKIAQGVMDFYRFLKHFVKKVNGLSNFEVHSP